jgi:hypothetical protein
MWTVAERFHLVHQPVVVAARFNCDLRVCRQLREECPVRPAIMLHANRFGRMALFIHRDEDRELFVGVAPDKMLHTLEAPPFRDSPAVYASAAALS